MQINSNTAINNDYSTSSKTQQATTSFAKALEEEQEKVTTSVTTSSVSKVDKPQTREYEVLTYANTKGMTNNEVDKYFSERTNEEREKIKYMIKVSNDFSDNDLANEAVFKEAELKENGYDQLKFSMKIDRGLKPFIKGIDYPPIRINDEWFKAIDSGITNPEKIGIYASPEAQYNYESGKTAFTPKLTEKEASEFFSTMENILKEWMEKSEGTMAYDDYKEDYEMYKRMSNNYNDLLLQQEENSSVNIQI